MINKITKEEVLEYFGKTKALCIYFVDYPEDK